MDGRDPLLQLIALVYAAPGSVDGWRTLLEGLHAAIGGSGANFISHDFRSRQSSVSVSAGFAPEDIQTYVTQWSAADPWASSPRVRALPSGSVALGHHFVPMAEMKRTVFYNEFGRHHDVVQCITGTIETGHARVSVVSVNRSEKMVPFGPDEAALLAELMPHLQRALQVHRRLADADALAVASTTALDLLAHGVMLVDAEGRVVYANRSAEELLRAGDGLTVSRKELFGSTGGETAALRALIGRVAATSRGAGAGAGGLMLIGRPSGRPPLRLLVAPVSHQHLVLGSAGVGTSGAAACLFITDPERQTLPAAIHLRQTFGLSGAETRVALALLEGDSVDQLSDRLCVSRNTVRTHLRRLFAKTGAARQADLMRVLLSAHAPLRFD